MGLDEGKKGRPDGQKRAPVTSLQTAKDVDMQAWETIPEVQTAVRNYQLFMNSLSDAQRAKLTKLRAKLVNDAKEKRASFKSEADADMLVARHMEAAGADRNMFETWWNLESALGTCRVRFNEAISLLWGKVALGVLQGDPLPHAKLAAANPAANAERIRSEAERGNKRFLIELGKCLSGEIKPQLVDDIDSAILHLLCSNRSIPAKEAVKQLKRQGWNMTEENFRMRKQRLKRAIIEAREAYDRSNKA